MGFFALGVCEGILFAMEAFDAAATMGSFITGLFFHVTPVTIFHDQSQMPAKLLDCSAEHVWWGSSLYSAPLKYDGQYNGFLLLDFSVVPDHLWLFGLQVFLPLQL